MKILLVEDHLLLAQGIQRVLEEGIANCKVEILEKVSDSLAFLNLDSYDLLLLDIHIKKIYPEGNGLDLGKKLLKKRPDLKIILLTGFDLPVYEKEAREMGARGFLSKEIPSKELIQKVEEVYKGGVLFKGDGRSLESLTPTEKRVVEYYCYGMTRKEVADKCNMATSSLAVILNRVYDKLEVQNYQQLCRKAMELGYVKMDFL